MKPLLCVPLDGLLRQKRQTLEKAAAICRAVPTDRLVLKVNLDCVVARGIATTVRQLRSFGTQLFVDLKMFNGSRTMGDVAEQLVDLDVDYFNVHILADKENETAIRAARHSDTRVLGVTVLSHMDDSYCRRIFNMPRTAVVRNLASLGQHLGCDGIILPADTLSSIDRKTFGCATGVRPDWYHDTRHAVETTPRKALELGADMVVCGSPIMNNKDPGAAAKRILEEMDSIG